jgi:UDP-GlcNAc:undecaprenyl-phosphate GlcNAc-1-phosphate transferase
MWKREGLVMVGSVGLMALVVTVLALAGLRRWAVRRGWVYRPQPDRWQPKGNPHSPTIALGGGIGIALGIFTALIVWALGCGEEMGSTWLRALPLALGAALLGLWDDLRNCSVQTKLLVQTMLGLGTALWVVRPPSFPSFFSVPLMAFWVVAMMNAVNMADNMDGVASGLVILSAVGYALLGAVTHNLSLIGASVALATTSIGFWLFNRPPALIFMGDMGSLLLGYLLAVLGGVATLGIYPYPLASLLAPALMMGCFGADMGFVVLWRATHGLPIMKGDCNHLSHRLAVWFGKSEWHANLTLYGLQALFCAGGLVVAVAPPLGAFIVIVAAILLLSLLFRWLWTVTP